MWILLAMYGLAAVPVVTNAAPDMCDIGALDEAAGDLIFFAGSGHEPPTKAELLAACPLSKKSLAFAQTYAEKCITGLGQGMVKIFLEGAAAEVEGKCDEASDRHRLYLENAACILSVGAQVHQCNKIIAAVLEVAREADVKQRIPQSCCFVSDYEDCVVTALSKCGAGAVDYGKSVIEGYAGDLLNSICRKWRHGSRGCLTLPKLKPHESPKYKTLLPPLVEVLQTLT